MIQNLLDDEGNLQENIRKVFQKHSQEGYADNEKFTEMIDELMEQFQIEKVNEEQKETILRSVSQAVDGKISFNEFVRMVRGHLEQEAENQAQIKEEQIQVKKFQRQETDIEITRQSRNLEAFLEESGLTLAIQTIFAEILSKRIQPSDVFSYTSMRLRQIRKEIDHLIPKSTGNPKPGAYFK